MNVIVIGGGASGMAAAIEAARKGANVKLIEKGERLGRKILATGNGKCNYSNKDCNEDSYNDNAKEFVKTVYSKVSPEETIEFFDELGIYPRLESEGRLYPASEQAASVCDALRMEVERLENIEVVTQHWIKGLLKRREGGFYVVSHRNLRLMTDKVIMACGGRAGSQYGCEGDGHALAEALNLEVIEPCPSLVQLTSNEEYFKQLKGVRAKGKVTLIEKDAHGGDPKPVDSEAGEIQFTEFGLSGICIFNLSGRANRLMYEKKKCSIVIDLFPEIEKEEFYEMLKLRLERSSHKDCEDFLNGLINKKLIPVVMKSSGVKKLNEKADTITEEQLRMIAHKLKAWEVTITGSKSWTDAQCTSGGVELSQIVPETMESKQYPGLYFAGEVLDVDGKCGGYNLQWAWSSGILAGRSAAEDTDA